MAAALSAIRDALEGVFAGIPGLRVYAFVPGSVDPPCVVLAPVSRAPMTYGHAAYRHQWRARVLVGLADQRAATDALEAFLPTGALDVAALVAADPTLGGVVDSAQVTEAGEFGFYAFGGVDYLGFDLAVDILDS